MGLVIAGGLWTIPFDLARFAIEIMKAYRSASDRLLPPNIALNFERSRSGTDFQQIHSPDDKKRSMALY
jgi:hypothetical protein